VRGLDPLDTGRVESSSAAPRAWMGSSSTTRAVARVGRSVTSGAIGLITLLAAIPLTAQTVHGHLLEQRSGRPVVAALVTLVGEVGETVARAETDSAGHFTLRSPEPGSFYVRAERIGYRTKTDGVLELGEGGEITIEFYLMPRPVELEGVEGITEGLDFFQRKDRAYLESQGFYDRMKLALGHFITPEELEERVVFDAWDVLRRVPGLDLTTPPRSEVRPPVCVRVDGILVHQEEDGAWRMIDDVSPEQVAGVEIYTRGRPVQYSGMADCSPLILVWTKG